MKSTIYLSSFFSPHVLVVAVVPHFFRINREREREIERESERQNFTLCIRINNETEKNKTQYEETKNDGRQKQKAFMVGIRAKIFQRYMTSQHKLLIPQTCQMHARTHVDFK